MPSSCLIFPGIHPKELTENFIKGLEINSIYIYDRFPAFSSSEQLNFIKENQSNLSKNLIIIAFSAGVVGAIDTAKTVQKWGYRITSFIAIDGWGVPLDGNFPISRLSSDHYTHWTSHLLGGGKMSFYADPGVSHLQMWQTSQEVTGWLLEEKGRGCTLRSRMTLKEALRHLTLTYDS